MFAIRLLTMDISSVHRREGHRVGAVSSFKAKGSFQEVESIVMDFMRFCGTVKWVAFQKILLSINNSHPAALHIDHRMRTVDVHEQILCYAVM
jgi:hypothetical protein